MKIATSSRNFHDAFETRSLDLFGFLRLAGELGLDGVEIEGRVFPSVSQRFLKELRSTVRVSPVEIGVIAVSNDFARPEASERQAQCDDVVAWTFVARELDVPVLRTLTGELREGVRERQAASWVTECYERVLGAAERAGVTLAVDPFGVAQGPPRARRAVENPSRVLGSAGELAGLVMHFGSASLQLSVDPMNFRDNSPAESGGGTGVAAASGSFSDEAYASLARVARFAVHSRLAVLDVDGASRPAGLDLARVLDIYRRACYNRYLSLDYAGDGDARDAVKKAATFLRTLIGA